eukprot:CAMPEP_0175071362 /NCGR_PEP_ID=MMETSP0052_2-20121109/19205_1 /TAXON_ID=51329 ORGANISM="Polytomella parva, Strain SAG 63-3" /NCGR_SAMPLE_ID=MMETSP0052_2 /ASSEMBLY_ACC=CAM_ASM_000194 /LENGTH=368 /DNA_ID=CAMNT_0016338533 /DNA_START=796 /DNA_END=1898 /DNA_ORIENTATION=+
MICNSLFKSKTSGINKDDDSIQKSDHCINNESIGKSNDGLVRDDYPLLNDKAIAMLDSLTPAWILPTAPPPPKALKELLEALEKLKEIAKDKRLEQKTVDDGKASDVSSSSPSSPSNRLPNCSIPSRTFDLAKEFETLRKFADLSTQEDQTHAIVKWVNGLSTSHQNAIASVATALKPLSDTLHLNGGSSITNLESNVTPSHTNVTNNHHDVSTPSTSDSPSPSSPSSRTTLLDPKTLEENVRLIVGAVHAARDVLEHASQTVQDASDAATKLRDDALSSFEGAKKGVEKSDLRYDREHGSGVGVAGGDHAMGANGRNISKNSISKNSISKNNDQGTSHTDPASAVTSGPSQHFSPSPLSSPSSSSSS